MHTKKWLQIFALTGVGYEISTSTEHATQKSRIVAKVAGEGNRSAAKSCYVYPAKAFSHRSIHHA
jgi:hypothetical protein